MRKRFVSAMFALLALLVQSAPKLGYQLHPLQKRSISIGLLPQLNLVKEGKVNFELVVPVQATPSAYYAANEMAELLGKALGCKVSITGKASGKMPAIIVGDAGYAKKAGLDIGALDRDGFYIKTFEGNVMIIGRDDPKRAPAYGNGDAGEHGTLFGVYDFLERFAGVRFFFPGELGTVIPSLQNWDLPAIEISERPDFQQRNLYYNCTSKKHKEVYRPKEYGKDERKDRFHQRYETWNWPCSHGLGAIGYQNRFAKTHPEYFAKQADGKSTLGTRKEVAYCYNSGIKDEIIKDAVSFLKGEPASARGVRPSHAPDKFAWPRHLDQRIPVFDISPDDGYLPCQCEKCRLHFLGDMSNDANLRKVSDFMWRFYADIANALKAEGVKGYVASWSYWPTIYEPDFDLPDNMLLVVTARGPWNYKNKKAWDAEQARIRAWGKRTGANIRLWNYWLKTPFGSLYDIPAMAPHAVAAYYKAVAPHICGAFAETEMERLIYQYLNHYVFYKMMWNMETDVNALLDEHYSLLFGEAAGTMREIYMMLEETWLSITGNSIDTAIGPKTVVPSDYDLWSKFYPQQKIDKVNSLFDKAAVQTAEDSLERRRVQFMRRELWQPTVDSRELWKRNSDLSGSWNGYASQGTPDAIDGKLGDQAWKKAPEMWLCAPVASQNYTHGNEVQSWVKVLYDQDNFYIGFNCIEPDDDKLIAAPHKAATKPYWANASLQVFMNVTNDRKGFFQIAVDKNGTVATLKWQNGVTQPWQNNVTVANHIEPGQRWQAEFVLPRKDLGAVQGSFPVNFMRYRPLIGQKPQVYYWYPFLSVTPLAPDKWGMLHLNQENNASLLKLGDFERPLDRNGRIGPWYGTKMQRDEKIYLTGGGSMKLDMDSNSLKQNFPLDADATYEISFFAKLENVGEKSNGGLFVRFDEFGGNVTILPTYGTYFRGTHDWTRFRYTIRTSPKCGSKAKPGSYSYQPYINFMFTKGTNGTAWLDHVQIRKIQ